MVNYVVDLDTVSDGNVQNHNRFLRCLPASGVEAPIPLTRALFNAVSMRDGEMLRQDCYLLTVLPFGHSELHCPSGLGRGKVSLQPKIDRHLLIPVNITHVLLIPLFN